MSLGDAALCWAVSDGRAGNESNVLGLAEAVGLPFAVKRVRARAPWRWMPAPLWLKPLDRLLPDSDPLAPPWPRLVIGCGRAAVPLVIAIRKASRGATFTVQVLDPRVPPAHFDLVVPPLHDGLKGPNVVPTWGALTRITPERLAAAAERFGPEIAALPRPLVAVLIGGTSRHHRLTPAVTEVLVARLRALTQDAGAGLLVTASRRTGPENARLLAEGLADAPAWVWDGTGENPYFGFLGLADAIVVTADSVAMTSEACSTGKPVYVVELEGGHPRLDAFQHSLREAGMTRPFAGRLEHWSYPPLDETRRVAAEVRRRLGL